jgi:hypothetical protein
MRKFWRGGDPCSPLGRKGTINLQASRILKLALASFVLGAAALPVSAAVPTTRTGAVIATFKVRFKVAPPGNSFVSCSVVLIGSDALSPSDTKTASVAVSGSAATCSLKLFYSWRLASPTSNMTIAYSVSGPEQTSSGTYETIVVPANGTNTKVTLAIVQ